MDENNSDNGNGEGNSAVCVHGLQCQEMAQLLWQPTSLWIGKLEYSNTQSANIAGLSRGLAICHISINCRAIKWCYVKSIGLLFQPRVLLPAQTKPL